MGWASDARGETFSKNIGLPALYNLTENGEAAVRLETHAAARGRRADANCSDGNIFRVVFRFDRHFYCFRVNPKKRLGPPAVMSHCVRHGHAAWACGAQTLCTTICTVGAGVEFQCPLLREG